jgi:hypothetical protein
MRKLLTGMAAIALVAPLCACGSTDHKAREAQVQADAKVDRNAPVEANAPATAPDANEINASNTGSTDHTP